MADSCVPVGSSSPDSHFLSTKSRRGHQIVVKSEGRRPPTHRIAFNSLYLFNLGLLSMKQMARHCLISRVEKTRPAPLSLEASSLLPVFARLHSQKRSGGVASMTRDRGYPDWLVLSAHLLRSGYHSAGCVLASGYV